jgi:hypothetical protein
VKGVHLHWATEPMHAKLFILFLLTASCFAIARTVGLARRLCRFSKSKRISFENIRDGVTDPNILAEHALSNGFSSEISIEGAPKSDSSTRDTREDSGLRTLQAAHAEFLYLWDMCHANVESLKRLVILILLFSFFVVAYGAFPTWTEMFDNANIAGTIALFRAIDALLARLALGLGVCAILYAIYGLFTGILMRRKASWEHFHSVVQDMLSRV